MILKQKNDMESNTPTELDITYRGDERRQHRGIYGLVSLGRGRKLGKVDCPFCNTAVDCYLWSISGSGKKCKCGAIIYRIVALRNISPITDDPKTEK